MCFVSVLSFRAVSQTVLHPAGLDKQAVVTARRLIYLLGGSKVPSSRRWQRGTQRQIRPRRSSGRDAKRDQLYTEVPRRDYGQPNLPKHSEWASRAIKHSELDEMARSETVAAGPKTELTSHICRRK